MIQIKKANTHPKRLSQPLGSSSEYKSTQHGDPSEASLLEAYVEYPGGPRNSDRLKGRKHQFQAKMRKWTGIGRRKTKPLTVDTHKGTTSVNSVDMLHCFEEEGIADVEVPMLACNVKMRCFIKLASQSPY